MISLAVKVSISATTTTRRTKVLAMPAIAGVSTSNDTDNTVHVSDVFFGIVLV